MSDKQSPDSTAPHADSLYELPGGVAFSLADAERGVVRFVVDDDDDGHVITARLTTRELNYLAGFLQERADLLAELPETDDEIEARREAELYAAADR